jgi:hypothetical protein
MVWWPFMAPDTDFDPDDLFNRNVFVKVATATNRRMTKLSDYGLFA